MRNLSLAERLQFDGARTLLGALSPYASKLFPQRAKPVDGLTLHPEAQLMLALRELRGARPWSQLSVARARAQVVSEARLSAGPAVPVGPVRDLEIPGPTGPLKVRHYMPPEPVANPPLLVFFHGGGFVLGDLDSHDQPCRILCKYAGVQVLSVTYRLAPEHPFPAGLEDALAGFRWAHANAQAFGADPTRVCVGGDSAGACLATVVAQMTHRAKEPEPAAQLLLYPCVDRVNSYRSLSLFADGYFLTLADIEWCTERYVGTADVHNPLISPLLAPDLKGLAPALIVTVGFDPLRDEGEAYESALRAAGCSTRHRRVPDLFHGFINATGVSPASERATLAVAHDFREFLKTLKAS